MRPSPRGPAPPACHCAPWRSGIRASISGPLPGLDGVALKAPARYQAGPWRALVDCLTAETILGWRPCYHWANRGAVH